MNIAYVAGLFDGEGWVRADDFHPKNRTFPRFQIVAGIAMTDKPVIMALHRQFGGKAYGDDSFQRRYAKNRVIYRWGLASKFAYDFLIQIAPFTIVKREQIELAIELQRRTTAFKAKMVGQTSHPEFKAAEIERRRELCEKIKALKKKNYPLVDDDPLPTALSRKR